MNVAFRPRFEVIRIIRLGPMPLQRAELALRYVSHNHVAQYKPCEDWSMERYSTVIHEDPDGGFWAEVPALPGCYSQGDTIQELVGNVREAIAGVLEVMKVMKE